MQIKLNFISTRVTLQERVKLLALDLKNWEKLSFFFHLQLAELRRQRTMQPSLSITGLGHDEELRDAKHRTSQSRQVPERWITPEGDSHLDTAK